MAGLWRRWPPDVQAILTVGVPVVCFAALAWQRRWMSDDGFINLRIVANVLDGDGPVYNPGERVEAGTSPLWIGMLVVARLPLWFLDTAWAAVLLGIALTLVGLAGAILGARHWWAAAGRAATLPLGAGALLVLPPMWDFASSGLETGLSFAWIGGCWWATSRRLENVSRPPLHRSWWTPVLIGLGPLVRPDLVVFTLAFAVALVATSRPSRGDALRALGAGLALPAAYQLFRMGYYGLLVPNTALAKESGRAVWGRGRIYAEDFLAGTHIWVPLLLLAALFVLLAVDAAPTRRQLVVAAAPAVGGLVHGLYVVRVGGDFMFARLLLPGVFGLVCPLAALPSPAAAARRSRTWALTGLAVVALGAVGTAYRWDPGPFVAFPDGVVDERHWWTNASHHPNPVTLDDYEQAPFVAGAEPPEGMVWDLLTDQSLPGSDTVMAYGAVGILGASQPDVRIADTMALTDPVGAHFEPGPPGRAGHEKPVIWAWTVGRYAQEPPADPTARAARRALGCGDLAELVDAVEEPLTAGRFLDNLFGSVQRTTLRVPPDPVAARDQLCN